MKKRKKNEPMFHPNINRKTFFFISIVSSFYVTNTPDVGNTIEHLHELNLVCCNTQKILLKSAMNYLAKANIFYCFWIDWNIIKI